MPASPTAAPASGIASEQERGPDGRLKLALPSQARFREGRRQSTARPAPCQRVAAPTSPWRISASRRKRLWRRPHAKQCRWDCHDVGGLFPPVQLRGGSRDGADAGVRWGTVMVIGLPVRGSNRVMVIRPPQNCNSPPSWTSVACCGALGCHRKGSPPLLVGA